MSDLEKMMQLISMLIQRNDTLEVKIDDLKYFNNELNMRLEKDIYELKTKIDFLAAKASSEI